MLAEVNDTLAVVYEGRDLDRGQTEVLFGAMVRGELDDANLAGMLLALKIKGETPDEVAGAAEALLEAATPFATPPGLAADVCGTGGDGHHTINVSTAVAVVGAAMEIPLVKHGNRSVSSRCGSADLLEQLGLPIDLDPEAARQSLDQAGICFLFAPSYHPGLRHAMPVRKALGTRTLLNLLGPIVNPGRPPVQMMGVYDPALCEPVAKTLGLLGRRSAWVVHGSGLDEVAVHGPTTVARYEDGTVELDTITPEDAGLDRYPLEAIRGHDPEQNADAIRAVLGGQGAAAHEAVVAMNAGTLAWLCGQAPSLKDGTALALDTLRSGRAAKRLDRWIEVCREIC